MGEDSELELLKRWRAGDRIAGNRLVTKYYPRIRRFFTGSVNDDDSQDLTNETFGRAMTTTVTVDDTTDVRIFLFCLARRVLYDHLRKSYRRDARGFDPLTHSVEDVEGVTPSRAVAQLDQYRRIVDCMRALPVETKTLLELYYWQGLTAEELAPIFEVKPPTIRTRIHAAKELLKRNLAGGGNPPHAQATIDETSAGQQDLGDPDDELTQDLRAVGRLLTSGPTAV